MSLSVSPSSATAYYSDEALSYVLSGSNSNGRTAVSIKLYEGASSNPRGDWESASWVWSSMGTINVSCIDIVSNAFSNSDTSGSMSFTVTPDDAWLYSAGSKTYTFFILWQRSEYDYAQFSINYNPIGFTSAPSTVTIGSANAAPTASIKLSWSGASAGTSNPITGYKIYRSSSALSGYTALTSNTVDVSTSNTYGEYYVAAPSKNGSTYYYKVKTIGTVSGYDSEESTAYASLTCTYTAPTAPSTVTIGGEASAYAAASAGTIELSWGGANAGTNNPITGYHIYQNGVYKQSATGTKAYVPINTTEGGSYTYTVYTIGTYSNSAASAGRTVYTYGAPTAPKTVYISNSQPDKDTDVTLYWEDAAGGAYNSISGYIVYRATSASGSYSKIAEVSSTSTSGSCTVKAPSEMGSSYYYKICTKGVRSNSSISTAYAVITAKTYTACYWSEQATITVSDTLSYGDVTLSWNGAEAGTNNDIAKYQIYYEDSSDGVNWGAETFLKSVSGAETASVSIPDTPGGYRRYTIYIIGTKEGFDSDGKTCETAVRRDHAALSGFTDST